MDYGSDFISCGYAYNCKALVPSSTVELYKCCSRASPLMMMLQLMSD